jgi:hypothetical protein
MTSATSSTAPVLVHTYALKRWDVFRTQIYGLSRNRAYVSLLIILSTFVAVSNLQQPEIAAHSLVFKVVLGIVFGAIFVTLIWTVTLIALLLMTLLQRHQGVLGKHTLEVTPPGLVERTEFNETLHRWPGIHKIVRTRRYLYLWVFDSMVHAVPVRSFESEDAARLFQREIETNRQTT